MKRIRVKKSTATRWNAAPFVLGAVSAAIPGGQPFAKVLSEPIGCMFLAGEATHETQWARRWRLESGERAAEAALEGIGALRDTQPAVPPARVSETAAANRGSADHLNSRGRRH